MIGLVALILLTALVWWRVLNRDKPHHQASLPVCKPAPTNLVPEPSTVALSVLNATTRDGLAKATATQLKKRGFVHVSYGNDVDHPGLTSVAQIRYGPAAASAAKLMQLYITGSTLVAQPTNASGTVTVSLGVQFRGLNSATAVQQRMVKFGLSVAPAPTSSSAAPSSATPGPTCTPPRPTKTKTVTAQPTQTHTVTAPAAGRSSSSR